MSRWQVLDDDGLPTGSYTASELLTLWRDGTLDHTALVWTDGMDEWITIADTQSRLQQEEADALAEEKLREEETMKSAADGGLTPQHLSEAKFDDDVNDNDETKAARR